MAKSYTRLYKILQFCMTIHDQMKNLTKNCSLQSSYRNRTRIVPQETHNIWLLVIILYNRTEKRVAKVLYDEWILRFSSDSYHIRYDHVWSDIQISEDHTVWFLDLGRVLRQSVLICYFRQILYFTCCTIPYDNGRRRFLIRFSVGSDTNG